MRIARGRWGAVAIASFVGSTVVSSPTAGQLNERITKQAFERQVEHLGLDGFELSAAPSLHATLERRRYEASRLSLDVRRWSTHPLTRDAYGLPDGTVPPHRPRLERSIRLHFGIETRLLEREYFEGLAALHDGPDWIVEALRLERVLRSARLARSCDLFGAPVAPVDLRLLRAQWMEDAPMDELGTAYGARLSSEAALIVAVLRPTLADARTHELEEWRTLCWRVRRMQQDFAVAMREEMPTVAGEAFYAHATAAINPFAFADSGLSWKPDEPATVTAARLDLVRAYERIFDPRNVARLDAEHARSHPGVRKCWASIALELEAWQKQMGASRHRRNRTPTPSHHTIPPRTSASALAETVRGLDASTAHAIEAAYGDLLAAMTFEVVPLDNSLDVAEILRIQLLPFDAEAAFEDHVATLLPDDRRRAWRSTRRAVRRRHTLSVGWPNRRRRCVVDLIAVLDEITAARGEPEWHELIEAYESDIDASVRLLEPLQKSVWWLERDYSDGAAADYRRARLELVEVKSTLNDLHNEYRDLFRSKLPDDLVLRYDEVLRRREHGWRFQPGPPALARPYIPHDIASREAIEAIYAQYAKQTLRIDDEMASLLERIAPYETLTGREAERMRELIARRTEIGVETARRLRRTIGDETLRDLPIARVVLTAMDERSPWE